MKKKSRKIASVALFSAFLSVGAGVIPTINNVVYAEEVSQNKKISDDEFIKAFHGVEKVSEDVFTGKGFDPFLANGNVGIDENELYYKPTIAKVPSYYVDVDQMRENCGNHCTLSTVGSYYYIRNSDNTPLQKGDTITITQKKKISPRYFSTNSGELKNLIDRLNKIDKNDNFQYNMSNYINGSVGEIKEGEIHYSADKAIEYKDLNVSCNEATTECEIKTTLTLKEDTDFLKLSNSALPWPFQQLVKDEEIPENGEFLVKEGVKIDNVTKNKTIVDITLKDFFVISNKATQSRLNIPYFSFMAQLKGDELANKNDLSDNQNVKANILNGGITGGIVNPEVGKDLAIQDIDFGKLSIGQVINPVKEDKMVSVRDWTGGNGWKLTAQHKETDRNKSLQLGVQVDNGNRVDLSDEAQLVTKGESQLDVTTQSGEYTATWGTHPTVGEFNNVIEWNLSANVTE